MTVQKKNSSAYVLKYRKNRPSGYTGIIESTVEDPILFYGTTLIIIPKGAVCDNVTINWQLSLGDLPFERFEMPRGYGGVEPGIFENDGEKNFTFIGNPEQKLIFDSYRLHSTQRANDWELMNLDNNHIYANKLISFNQKCLLNSDVLDWYDYNNGEEYCDIDRYSDITEGYYTVESISGNTINLSNNKSFTLESSSNVKKFKVGQNIYWKKDSVYGCIPKNWIYEAYTINKIELPRKLYNIISNITNSKGQQVEILAIKNDCIEIDAIGWDESDYINIEIKAQLNPTYSKEDKIIAKVVGSYKQLIDFSSDVSIPKTYVPRSFDIWELCHQGVIDIPDNFDIDNTWEAACGYRIQITVSNNKSVPDDLIIYFPNGDGDPINFLSDIGDERTFYIEVGAAYNYNSDLDLWNYINIESAKMNSKTYIDGLNID